MNIVLSRHQYHLLQDIGDLYLKKGQEKIQFLFSSSTIKAYTTSIKDVTDQANAEEIVWHV